MISYILGAYVCGFCWAFAIGVLELEKTEMIASHDVARLMKNSLLWPGRLWARLAKPRA